MNLPPVKTLNKIVEKNTARITLKKCYNVLLGHRELLKIHKVLRGICKFYWITGDIS